MIITTTAETLPNEPEHEEDPGWAYDLTKEQRYTGWPCGECGIRRGEHADQGIDHIAGKSVLDMGLAITDHTFVEQFTLCTTQEAQ